MCQNQHSYIPCRVARVCCMQWHNHMLLSLIYYGELLKYAWIQWAGYNTTPIVVNTGDSVDKEVMGVSLQKWPDLEEEADPDQHPAQQNCSVECISLASCSYQQLACLKPDLCLLKATCSVHIIVTHSHNQWYSCIVAYLLSLFSVIVSLFWLAACFRWMWRYPISNCSWSG